MSAFLPLTRNGFREARRNRVTVVVAVFAILLLLTSTLLTDLTVSTFDRVLIDVGLGTQSLFLALLAVFLSTAQITREIERKTIYLIVTRPMSRTTFLLGRYAGNMLTLAVLLLGTGGVFILQLLLYRVDLSPVQLAAMALLFVELMVISAIGFALSSFASQAVSAMVTTALFFAGHLSADLYNSAVRSENVAVRWLGKAVYYALPNLERLNLRPLATYAQSPELAQTLAAAGSGVAYTAVMLAIAALVFARRDFR